MKRILAAVLMASLCISLCACRHSNASGRPTFPLYDPDNTDPPTDVGENDEHLRHIVLGQWILTNSARNVPPQVLFRDDMTCVIEGTTYPWVFTYISSNSFGVEILISENEKKEISFGKSKTSERIMCISNEYGTGRYINPAHFDIIQINQANWQEYFQLIPWRGWDVDNSGKITGLDTCSFNLELKEQYISRLSSTVTEGDLLTKNTIEFSFSHGRQKYLLDTENRICTPIEGDYTFESKGSFAGEFTHLIPGGGSYRLWIHNGFDGPNEDTIPYLYDITLLYADCPLYLVKDEYAVKYAIKD